MCFVCMQEVDAQAVVQHTTVPSGTTETTTQNLGNGGSLTIERGGSIIANTFRKSSAVLGVNIETVTNRGVIASETGNGVASYEAIETLINERSGRIRGEISGVVTGTDIGHLANRGVISGGVLGIFTMGNIETLVNEADARIIGVHGGVHAGTITSLINNGDIISKNGAGVLAHNSLDLSAPAGNLISLINQGTINADTVGVGAAREITNLINRGIIRGGLVGVNADAIQTLTNESDARISSQEAEGVFATNITSLANGGIIEGGTAGVAALGSIARLVNEKSGVIRAGSKPYNSGINASFGTVINRGLIEGYAGIKFDRNTVGNAVIINSGAIRSTEGAAGFAIDLQGEGSDTITLLGASVVEGRIAWDGTGDTLNYRAKGSAALTFAGIEPDEELAPIPGRPAQFIVNADGRPVVRANHGAAETTIVVIDPTAFALADNILFDTTSAISAAVTGQAAAWRATRSGGRIISPAADVIRSDGHSISEGGWFTRLWADLFGGVRDEEGDGALGDARHDFGGVVAGAETGTAAMRVGFFIGGSVGKADIEGGSQDIDITTVFGGPYFSAEGDGVAVDGMVTFGLSDYDSTRSVNDNLIAGGVDSAKADYNGFFVAPEITVSSSLGMVRPSLTLRYAGLFLESYSEESSILAAQGAGLNVDDRDIHQISARAQLGLPLTMDEGRLSTELRVGAEGRAQLGKARVRGSVLGQGFTFDAGGDDEVLTGFGGFAVAYAVSSRFTLNGNVEGAYGTDEAATGRAHLGAKLEF